MSRIIFIFVFVQYAFLQIIFIFVLVHQKNYSLHFDTDRQTTDRQTDGATTRLLVLLWRAKKLIEQIIVSDKKYI